MTLKDFFKKYPCVGIAFSGGTDSSYLLYEAKKNASRVCAYYVKSAFQPDFETEDATSLCKHLGIDLKILPVDILSYKNIKENKENRCYLCKTIIMKTILSEAKIDGFSVLIEGTNASDNIEERPGFKALTELSVLSPLRLCGLTKKKIRENSESAGLFTWNKSSYSCLATRIPFNTALSAVLLKNTEKAEKYLSSLGLEDFRVIYSNGNAIIKVKENQKKVVIEHSQEINSKLKEYYSSIMLDLEARK